MNFLSQPFRVFVTGGTIDCHSTHPGCFEYVFSETHVPHILGQARLNTPFSVDVLMLKDSLQMTDEDRTLIAASCLACPENHILVTHGTDTMVQTATVLAHSVANKTIVLTGSMIPYNRDGSDALFNVGTAVVALQLLPAGIYICMSGRVLPWDNVYKVSSSKGFVPLLEER